MPQNLLGRAQQTADIIASAHQIFPIARRELRELNMGDWDRTTFSEIKAKYRLKYMNHTLNWRKSIMLTPLC